jgi:hypothetical protein
LRYIARKKSLEKEEMEPKIKADLGLVHDILAKRCEGSKPLGSRAPDPEMVPFLLTCMAEMYSRIY